MKNKEIELILTKLKIVSEEKENGAYICDKEHSKLLLSYIEQLEADYKEANDSITWWKNRFNVVERDNRDYKSRIDKAIEYIEKHTDKIKKIVIPKIDFNYKKLLDILKGDSDE